MGKSVYKAVDAVNTKVAPALIGMDPTKQVSPSLPLALPAAGAGAWRLLLLLLLRAAWPPTRQLTPRAHTRPPPPHPFSCAGGD